MLPLVLLAATTLPAPADAAPARDPGPDTVVTTDSPRPRSYVVRMGVGLGWPAASPQRDALEQDGYTTGKRPWAHVDATVMGTDHLGFGAWGATHWTSDDPEGGPTLRERVWVGGFQAPLLLDAGSTTFMFVPRLGVAMGSVHFHDADYKSAVAGGGEIGLLVPIKGGREGIRPSIGFNVGALWAPSPKPGDVGREHNLGGFYFSVSGAVDG